eukprot:UN3273
MFEMKKLDAASSEKIFHAADVDGDQKLILREFMALTFDWKGVTKEVKDHGLRSLFRQIDANGSGSVSEKELTNALHGAVDPMAVRDVFTAMDTDRSGKVSEDEFEKFLFEPCSDELQSKYSEAAFPCGRRQPRLFPWPVCAPMELRGSVEVAVFEPSTW